MLLDEIPFKSNLNKLNGNCEKQIKSSIRVKQIAAKWEKSSKIPTFKNISLDLKEGDLLIVIGPIGSGKVSFKLKIINITVLYCYRVRF